MPWRRRHLFPRQRQLISPWAWGNPNASWKGVPFRTPGESCPSFCASACHIPVLRLHLSHPGSQRFFFMSTLGTFLKSDIKTTRGYHVARGLLAGFFLTRTCNKSPSLTFCPTLLPVLNMLGICSGSPLCKVFSCLSGHFCHHPALWIVPLVPGFPCTPPPRSPALRHQEGKTSSPKATERGYF